VFALESAMDECARAAGVDPVQFRLDHMTDPRLAGVLRMAVAAAESTQPPATTPQARRGRGVACGIYKEMSYAAVVADVQVNPATGEVRVMHIWCAHDCGHVINADQVRAQCEGNLVWGLGMVLIEQLPVGTSEVAAMNFGDSPIPRMGDVPPLQVLLVDSTAPPTGAGETAIVASAAAIANAIRDAVGVRPTRLPVRAEDLRTMMDGPATSAVPARP
jgi:isoquinoline 1-oxidoreductase beta subunit